MTTSLPLSLVSGVKQIIWLLEYCVLAGVYLVISLTESGLQICWRCKFACVIGRACWRIAPSFLRMQYPGYFGAATTRRNNTGNGSHAEQVLDRVKRGIRLKMDKVLDAYLTGGDSDFPSCDSPIWIFGRSYSVNYGKEPSNQYDFKSRLNL